jgi:hypothetical protein
LIPNPFDNENNDEIEIYIQNFTDKSGPPFLIMEKLVGTTIKNILRFNPNSIWYRGHEYFF